ncbi:MAG: hypothetical protein AAFY41_19435, partial [Bacteroidota bacterium]
MFGFGKRDKVEKSTLEFTFSHSKPLIYVPNHGESSDSDLPSLLWKKVFHDEFDVYISRAELDLKKAMQLLSFNTDSTIDSFQAIAALSLPKNATALIWVTQALLQRRYQKPNLNSPFHERNRDARFLFQQLSRLNLDPWYSYSINWVPLDRLSPALQFSPGHPIPGQIYRKHLLSTQQNFYYPIDTYFALIFEERKQAVINLLEVLGATKVIVSSVGQGTSLETREAQCEIIKFAPRSQRLSSKPDPLQHPWLGYESSWQSLVDTCLKRRASSIQCE